MKQRRLPRPTNPHEIEEASRIAAKEILEKDILPNILDVDENGWSDTRMVTHFIWRELTKLMLGYELPNVTADVLAREVHQIAYREELQGDNKPQ